MDLRKLRKLLGTLAEHGVTAYRDADLTLQFGGVIAAPTGDVEGELELPPGVPDAAAALAHIRKAYEQPAKRRAS